MNRIIPFKGKIFLFFDRFRYSFRFQKSGRFFNIIILEKYKSYIKNIKFIITLVGLFSAYIVFNSVHIAFIFGLILFLIGWFFERFIFLYSTLYLHPHPSFRLYPNKWIGCLFGCIVPAGNKDIELPLVGATYNDIEYAKNIHSLILSWTHGEYDDNKKNVLLSVIIDKDKYYFFIYPNYENEYAQKKLKKFKKRIKKMDINGVAEFQYLTFILGRRFDISDKSYLPVFRKKYRNGNTPFIYKFYYAQDVSKQEMINDLRDFIFYNLKIKERKNLTHKDLEYSLLKILG